jgi:multiple sugar transport system substrate-binding protein
MFGRAARGQASPKQAVADAHDRAEAIFKNWRGRGLVGG